MSNNTVIKLNENTITLVEGEVRDFPITLVLSNRDYKPLDITGNTAIVARFISQNSSFIEVTKASGQITEVDVASGRININLTSTNTLELAKGDKQSFEVVTTLAGGAIRISQFIGRLNVRPRISC